MAPITRFLRTHVLQSVIAAAVVVALAAGGVAYAVASSGSSSGPPAAAAAAPPATSPPTTSPPVPAKRHPVLRGLLTAIAPGTWTVRTKTGRTISVVVSPQTQFGTRKAPLASSAFAVGDRVVVSGPRTQTTVVAARIAKVPVKAPGATTSTTGPAPTTAPATAG